MSGSISIKVISWRISTWLTKGCWYQPLKDITRFSWMSCTRAPENSTCTKRVIMKRWSGPGLGSFDTHSSTVRGTNQNTQSQLCMYRKGNVWAWAPTVTVLRALSFLQWRLSSDNDAMSALVQLTYVLTERYEAKMKQCIDHLLPKQQIAKWSRCEVHAVETPWGRKSAKHNSFSLIKSGDFAPWYRLMLSARRDMGALCVLLCLAAAMKRTMVWNLYCERANTFYSFTRSATVVFVGRILAHNDANSVLQSHFLYVTFFSVSLTFSLISFHNLLSCFFNFARTDNIT